jgi:hypothetical protein
MDLSERNRTSRRRGCARNRRMYGGASYSFTGPLSAEVGGFSSNTVTQVSDCENVARPTLNPGVGLPGMSGGKRTRKNNGQALSLNDPMVIAPLSPSPAPLVGGGRRRRRRQAGGRYPNGLQAGGRYGFGTEIVGDAGIALGLRPQIPCEISVHNTLNPGVATPSTLPHRGGGSDSMAYYAPTAGYANVPNGGPGQVPFMAQVPYEARANNPACAKTGGRRRSTRKSRRSSRKSKRSSRRN